MAWPVIVGVIMTLVLAGCGDGADEPFEFGDWNEVEEGQARDWVVESMNCEGDLRLQLVGVVDGKLRYRRSNNCVEAGQAFWANAPEEAGDSAEVIVNSESEEVMAVTVEVIDENHFELVGESTAEPIQMRRVDEDQNPIAIPGLSDFDLAGQWLMEGYPCFDEQVPQVVRIIDPPSPSIHLNKVLGDACLGDGEAFLDAEISGTRVVGTPKLDEDWEVGEVPSDEEEPVDVEAVGTVRTEHFIRLEVLGEAVDLRRVYD